MARVPVSEDYRTGEGGELFPRLSKLETGEYARLCVPEDAAWAEWVHTMRAPKIEHGVAIMIDKQRKDGSTYPDYLTVFVGQRLCAGDPAVLEDKGVDPSRCPACEAASRGVKDMKPVRRFALPVIRYATRTPRTADLRPQPGAEILIWALTAKMYDQLLDLAKQMREMLRIAPEAPMNLRQMDVVLECESGDFQRMKFHPPRYPGYQDPAVGAGYAALIGALWADADSRPTDAQLRAACGKEPDKGYMLADVRKTEESWRIAEGGTAPAADPLKSAGGDGASLGTGLDQLLSGGRPAAGQDVDQHEAAPAAASDPFGGQGMQQFGAAETGLPAADPIAAGATTTGTPAQAAAGPSPTAPSAAPGAPASDPFGPGAPAQPPAQSPAATTAPSPEPSPAQPQANPFAAAASGTPAPASAAPTSPAAAAPATASPAPAPAAEPAQARPTMSFDQILGLTQPAS